jgi:ankyrin repeat protein
MFEDLKKMISPELISGEGLDPIKSMIISNPGLLKEFDSAGRTALNIAAERGCKDVVGLLIQHMSKDEINKANNNGYTPLHYCASRGWTEIVSLLIPQMTTETISKANSSRWTALHYAAEKGHKDISKLLIPNMTTEARNQTNSDGKKAIDYASANGHTDIEKLLTNPELNKGDVHARQYQSFEDLKKLIASRNLEAIKSMIISNPELLNQTDTRFLGSTALHFAAYDGNIDIVKYLIDEKGMDVNKTNCDCTPLYWAANAGHIDIIRYLILKMTKDAINQADSSGDTALHKAAEKGHIEMANLLLDRMSDTAIKQVDKNGDTALHKAAEKGHIEMANLLLDRMSDTAIKQVDKDGRTALHWAAIYGHKELVKYLIEKGMDLNKVDKDGKTAIHYGLKYPDMLTLLIPEMNVEQIKHLLEWFICSACSSESTHHVGKPRYSETDLHFDEETKGLAKDLVNH